MKQLYIILTVVGICLGMFYLSYSIHYTLYPSEVIDVKIQNISHEVVRANGLKVDVDRQYRIEKSTRVLRKGYWIYTKDTPVDTTITQIIGEK